MRQLEPPIMPADTLETTLMQLAGQLFQSDTPSLSNSEQWSVLHTYPRAEKRVAEYLLKSTASFFLPLFHRDVRRQRRNVRTYHPLFAGYLFLYEARSFMMPSIVESRVVSHIPVDDQKKLHGDLRAIHGLLNSGEPIAPEDRIEAGQTAEIISGPLKGYRGVVVRRNSRRWFIVRVGFLNCGASVEVSPDQIRVVT